MTEIALTAEKSWGVEKTCCYPEFSENHELLLVWTTRFRYSNNYQNNYLTKRHQQKQWTRECYITYDMDFRFIPSDPVCFDKLSRCDEQTWIWPHIRALGYNRCVTGKRPREENHAVRFKQRQRIAVLRGTCSRSDRLWWACKRVQALAPPGSRKKIWEEEVLSLSICLSTHLSHSTETSTLSRIKCERYIFL